MATVLNIVGSRLASHVRIWLAGKNAGVINWNKTRDFILAAAYKNIALKDFDWSDVIVRWRDVTVSGSFMNLSTTGEINSSGDTLLVNDNALTYEESTFGGDIGLGNWVNGLEREAHNNVSITLPPGSGTECHWAIRPLIAQNGHKYEFELYDNSNGVAIGILAATITMAGIAAVSSTIIKMYQRNFGPIKMIKSEVSIYKRPIFDPIKIIKSEVKIYKRRIFDVIKFIK